MQQRYYDPQLGRFLSVDPVAASAGPNFNRYDYANDNPYRFADPDGRMSMEEAKYKSEQARARRERHEANERAAHTGLTSGGSRDAVRTGPAPGAGKSSAASTRQKTQPALTVGVEGGLELFLLVGGGSIHGGVVGGSDRDACLVVTVCGQVGLGIYGGADVSVPVGYESDGTRGVRGPEVGMVAGLGAGPAAGIELNTDLKGVSGSISIPEPKMKMGAGAGGFVAGQVCSTGAACLSDP